MSKLRIGSGFDAHRFGSKEVLTIRLGGVDVPYHKEILAHSDGDVLLHALCDALFGALALGDIGRHFPDTNPIFKDSDSRSLLRATMDKIAQLDYSVVNVDLTLIAEKPRVANYIDNMRGCIAEDLKIDLSLVSVKATTTEGLGFVGREEGIAAEATVLLEMKP
ncbi:MAG: 2-C-methyl-D-erythritol 2,4-cyclodiphosphate synthase [Pseudomonadales bacterium]|nr:2-C-methyl-D-erythritol 2,4-cyclodiphosphate synthase [Pseudomonadales bacterium]